MKLNTQRKRSIVTLAASSTKFANQIVLFLESKNCSRYFNKVKKAAPFYGNRLKRLLLLMTTNASTFAKSISLLTIISTLFGLHDSLFMAFCYTSIAYVNTVKITYLFNESSG